MGVHKLFGMFVSKIASVIVNNFVEPFGLMIDLNGFIHKCAQTVFGYGNDFYNVPIPEDVKLVIRQSLKTKQGFEQLKLQFLNFIPIMLTKLILEKLKPTDFLIMAIDGKAPIAKGKQQLLRRTTAGFERHTYIPARGDIPPDEKFDTSYLTAGTPFMRDVTDAVEKWILANKNNLPYYVLFSGSDVEGEGEHKIFAMLERLKVEILNRNYGDTSKDLDKLFRSQPICVYGSDADLFSLSSMRDYNFNWVREPYNLNKLEEAVNIDIARNYITEGMTKNFPEMTKEQKNKTFDDFTVLSFLIGDDFVPAMFPLTGNIKETLDTFIETYNKHGIETIKSGEGFYYLTNDSDINMTKLTQLMNLLVDVEKKLFGDRKEVNEAETSIILENTQENVEKIKKLRLKNKIKFSSEETYTRSPYLDLSYENFCIEWKKVLRRPCIMSNRCPNSYRIESLIYNTQEELDRNSDDACQDYITGLRWNFAYYKGKSMGNWFYKRALPPTIHALSTFLNEGKYKMCYIERQIGEPIISPTQMLVMTLSPHFNYDVIKSIFKTDNAYSNATINCRFLMANFPKVIAFIFQGKYKSEEHSKIPLVPQILIEEVLKIIPQIKNEVHKQHPIEWTLGNVNNETWSKLIKSKINFGRTNEIKFIENENKKETKTRFKSPPKNETKEPSNKLNDYVNKSKSTLGGGGNQQQNRENRPQGRGNKSFGRGRGGRNQADITNSMKVGKFGIIKVSSNPDNNSNF